MSAEAVARGYSGPWVIEELNVEELAAVRAMRRTKPLKVISMADVATWPARPSARIKDGAIRCGSCGEPADTIHLLPWCIKTKAVEAACPGHDPGGYWFRISDCCGDGFGGWLSHLAGKHGGGGVVALIRWLGRDGVALLWRDPAV